MMRERKGEKSGVKGKEKMGRKGERMREDMPW